MADQTNDDWSDRNRPKGPPNKKQSQGPSDLIRIMYPISNLASLRKGGKVRSKKRMKERS